jgi:N-glycosidase YbiA
MINGFKDEYRFLSNFWHARVVLDGQIFPSVEHAYQAAKTLDRPSRIAIALCETPGAAKRAGKQAPMRDGWDDMKLAVMEDLLRQKFKDPELADQLLDTEGHELVEGNFWGDVFWGVCRGKGENHLGKLLMKIRSELLEAS